MKEYDICILGAGIAGLYCARELSKRYPESKICILEKYKFIGGRISTFRNADLDISWEAGAGRIHKSHHMVLSMLKEYKLPVYPMTPGIDYRTSVRVEPVEFGRYLETVSSIKQLPNLHSTTIKKVLEKTLGKSRTTELIDRYEYRSELDTLRADNALDLLGKEIGHQGGFYGVKGGFSSLIGALKDDIEAKGVEILRSHEVLTIDKAVKDSTYRVILKEKSPVRASKVIVALPRDAVAQIKCFQNLHILKQVKMRPLLRIYAVFPIHKGTPWFQDIKKFICDLPIRYVIPIDATKGTMMISYTDGNNALYWMDRITRLGEGHVVDECVKQLRSLFPRIEIPDPIYYKSHAWNDGCSYWLPSSNGYDSLIESKKSLIPLPDSMPEVYMCGESWADHQCWVESALETASAAVAKAST